ncbi:MAG: AsmA family protein, partial [Congregibacter sp.]|nr:AsmA family protein [Congregibacter sp.]
AQSSDEPIDFEALLAPLGRLPQQIDIASVHLISRSSNVWIFPLHDVRASRNAQGSMDVTAQANIAQRDVLLNARANWLELKGNHRLDLSAVISGLQEDSQLNATGYLDATGAALSYKMSVQGRYESVSDFLQALDDNAYPFAGNLSVAGTLQGDLDGYTLSLDEIGLRDGDAYAFSASGIITQRGSDAVSLDLNARGTARQLDGILPLEGALADMLERTELEMTVAGTLDSPILQSAALVLYGPGDTRLSLSSQSQTLTLADLQALSPRQTIHANIDAQIGNLAALLPVSTLESDTFLQSKIAGVSASFTGEAHGLLDELRVDINDLTVRHPQYLLSAKTQLLWRQDVLSAPTLELTLDDAGGADSDRAGTLRAKGSIADLLALRGLGLQMTLDGFSPGKAMEVAGSALPVALGPVSGNGLLLRAADALRVTDLDLTVDILPDMPLQIRGDAALFKNDITADLTMVLPPPSAQAWQNLTAISPPPGKAEASLRLRPTYVTILSDVLIGATKLQGVASADLSNNTIERLSVDLYSSELRLDDFAHSQKPAETPKADVPFSIEGLSEALPNFPVTLSFRSGHVVGPLSDLENVSVGVDVEAGRITLRELDMRYAGGELMLRGNIDSSISPAAISLAGRGIHVPLGALTEDLGVQQSVSGALSFQGGLVTRGATQDAWEKNLQGRLSTALENVTVSGAAYDLLMSNLLAWLVKGAGEKTTTFTCSMAQFDISAGVARSDSLYIETPRMLATGKASVDLAKHTLDVRIEPRSKTRTFQFPSAVHLQGDLGAPDLRVSPLQASADLSAQALLLLPSLTLKLFGLNGPDNTYKACETKDY